MYEAFFHHSESARGFQWSTKRNSPPDAPKETAHLIQHRGGALGCYHRSAQHPSQSHRSQTSSKHRLFLTIASKTMFSPNEQNSFLEHTSIFKLENQHFQFRRRFFFSKRNAVSLVSLPEVRATSNSLGFKTNKWCRSWKSNIFFMEN